MVDCPICISTFRKPVCLPCGHIYCKKCIADHVNSPGNTSLTSNCPECRTPFPTTVPDLSYLPEKYHPFISHSLRRVYVDFKVDANLQKKLKETEDRLTTKRRAEEALLKRCESLQSSLEAHRLGEREAMDQVEDLEEKLEDAEAEYNDYMEVTKKEITDLMVKNQSYRHNQQDMLDQLEDLKEQLAFSERRRRELEREVTPQYEALSDGSYCDDSWDNVRKRVIKPLPKRRATRAREDDTVALSSSKRARVVASRW